MLGLEALDRKQARRAAVLSGFEEGQVTEQQIQTMLRGILGCCAKQPEVWFFVGIDMKQKATILFKKKAHLKKVPLTSMVVATTITSHTPHNAASRHQSRRMARRLWGWDEIHLLGWGPQGWAGAYRC